MEATASHKFRDKLSSARLLPIVQCLAIFALVDAARACDLCSIYSAAQARGETGKGFFAGVAEQFTHFGALQDEGRRVADPARQSLDSSISQVFSGYNFNDRFGLQLSVPIIHRSFQRPEGFAIDHGVESGLGDMALLGNFRLFRHEKKHETFSWTLLAGLKCPTGSSDRLKEEQNEIEVPGAPANGIHGHDLTLGTGSVDGIVGTSLFARHRRFYATLNVQYSIRTKGDYEYRFANDFTWSGGPGYFISLTDDYTVAAQLNCSGEHKGLDTFEGRGAGDTGVTAFYVGPQISFTWSDKLSADAGIDIPVSVQNSSLQLVPDYRVRGGITWHF